MNTQSVRVASNDSAQTARDKSDAVGE